MRVKLHNKIKKLIQEKHVKHFNQTSEKLLSELLEVNSNEK